MSTDRPSLRATLAFLLAGSAIVFFVGIYLERGATAPASPAAGEPSSQSVSFAPAEGASGEAGEARPSAAPAPATGETAVESAAEHATESWPLGIDLEAPLLVGGVVVLSLVLALAVVRIGGPLVPLVIAVFAVVFALFDLLEVVHQVGQARTGLAMIALGLLVAHEAAGLIALRLVLSRRATRAGA